MKLLKEISANELDYLPNSVSLVIGNLNLPPTIFVDANREFLYVYYTNTKATEQKYIINPENLISFYPFADAVLLDQYPIDIYYIKADQLYSTSGRNSLFEITSAYAACEESGVYPNRFEIDGINTTVNTAVCSGSAPAGGVCVSVPAYSAGYFKIQMSAFELRLGEMNNVFSVYPNPANTHFYILNNAAIDVQNSYDIELLDVTGKSVIKLNITEGQAVPIQQLPPGAYTVLIYNQYNHVEAEKLLKIK